MGTLLSPCSPTRGDSVGVPPTGISPLARASAARRIWSRARLFRELDVLAKSNSGATVFMSRDGLAGLL